jgi:hypothetical protein
MWCIGPKGHPYLTQTLCRGLTARSPSEATDTATTDATVDAAVERVFLRAEAAREEANLKFVRSRLTQGTSDLRAALRTYQQVLAGKSVQDKPASSIHASLKLAGVVRTDAGGHLRPRNRIYQRVFGPDWVKRELPRDRWRTVATAAAVLLVLGSGVSFYTLGRQGTELDQATFQAELLERLTASDYQGLVSLSRDQTNSWDRAVLTEDVLGGIDPKVFAAVPWLSEAFEASALLDTIDQGYRLYVPSRRLFGAITFALEEVWLRIIDAAVKQRALTLAETVRNAFIEYHAKKTPGFEPPPARAADDP